MKNKKFIIFIACIPLCIYLLWALWQIIAWLLIAAMAFLNSPELPEPVITYGEFPFRLEYKVDGETVVIEDVIICEYMGVRDLSIGDKYRSWKRSFKYDEANLLLFEDDDIRITCSVGMASYYMGDCDSVLHKPIPPKEPYLGIRKKEQGLLHLVVNAEEKTEIMELYNIEFVDAKFSEPIENSFKDSQGRITDG